MPRRARQRKAGAPCAFGLADEGIPRRQSRGVFAAAAVAGNALLSCDAHTFAAEHGTCVRVGGGGGGGASSSLPARFALAGELLVPTPRARGRNAPFLICFVTFRESRPPV